MTTLHPRWTAIGALLGGLAVAMGAFAAHGLKARFASLAATDFNPREIFDLAARYHAIHSLALIAACIRFGETSERWSNAARWAFLIGITVFCGSLYLLGVTAVKWLGAITPIGGVALIAGWAFFAVAAFKSTERSSLA